MPEERADLLRHFKIPVNVLDGFSRPEPAALAACHEDLRIADQRTQTLLRELEQAVTERTRLQEQNTVYAGLMQTHSDTISELQRQYTAEVARLRSDMRSEYDAMESRLRQAERRESILAVDAKRWDQLVYELRWPDGPRAVRAILPLACALRRLNRALPQARPTEIAVASFDQPAVADPGTPPPRRSLARRLAFLCYAPIRPFARPIAWRSRSFLTGEIRLELVRLNGTLQRLADGITQLNDRHGESAISNTELSKMLEETLLTLALEADGSCR